MTDKQDRKDAQDKQDAKEERAQAKQDAKDEKAAVEADAAEEAIKHPDPKRHPKEGDKVHVVLGPGAHQKHTLKVIKAREDITSPDGQIAVEVKLDYDNLTLMHKSHNGLLPYWEWPE